MIPTNFILINDWLMTWSRLFCIWICVKLLLGRLYFSCTNLCLNEVIQISDVNAINFIIKDSTNQYILNITATNQITTITITVISILVFDPCFQCLRCLLCVHCLTCLELVDELLMLYCSLASAHRKNPHPLPDEYFWQPQNILPRLVGVLDVFSSAYIPQ